MAKRLATGGRLGESSSCETSTRTRRFNLTRSGREFRSRRPSRRVRLRRRRPTHWRQLELRFGDLFFAKKTPAKTADSDEGYDRHREAMAEASRERSAQGRDVGELPPVGNKRRRDKCRKNLRLFLETYFQERFPLDWSEDHLKVIARIELAFLVGGLFALAMPRGSGKTTICECAVLWAALYGHHNFVVLIGASSDAACEMLDSIKSELDSNDSLLDDFPEVCVPVRALEGNAQRCNGQTHQGQRTLIKWKKTYIVFPRIEGSVSSEAVIKVAGITGRVRGMKYQRSDGHTIRPSAALLDDIQTDDSAYSPQQCARRLKTVNGAILKLAGPGKKISAVATLTVIRRGDAADTVLDRDQCAQWQGERCKMLYAFPSDMSLWKHYGILRAESLRSGGDGSPAREYYRENRKAMDAGAQVAWPERVEPGDLSALESAMKLWLDDKYSFMAECQNDPLDEDMSETDLKPAEVVSRFSGRGRGVVPIWAGKVTAFVDVQGSALYWLVAGWDPTCFEGAVLDYGVFPDQPGRTYHTLDTLQFTLQTLLPNAAIEAQLRHGLDQLVPKILGREWQREGGGVLRVDRMLIDAGFQTDTIYEFCRATPFASQIFPSHGRAIGAKSKPMDQYAVKPGEQKKFRCFLTSGSGKRAIRHMLIDTYFWKSFLVQRFRQAIGEKGALTLWGSDRRDADHAMLADHLCAEKSILVEANGRKVVEWMLRPGRPDNHWLDCLVGAAAAASFEGVSLTGQESPKKKLSWREQQRRKLNGQ